MAPPKVRADYEQLKAMAGRFGGQAQAARQTLQALQRQMEVLQGGDWIGQGATAFYQEMGGQVLPTLKRLVGALEAGQQSTLQISQIMAQAEAEAARVLRGDGGGQGAAFMGVAGPGGGSGSGAGSGSGGGSGGAGGAGGDATPQEIAASIEKMVETMGIVGTVLGMDNDQLPAAASAGVMQGLAGASPAVKEAVMKALEEGAVDRKLAKFSPGARDLAKQSPTLRREIFQLQQDNYRITTGPLADGYATNRARQTIVIDQPLGDSDTVAHIAHEVGHATSPQVDRIPETPTMTKDEYVRLNVDNKMRNEGQAQFNAANVREDIKEAGGPDISIPSNGQSADYIQAYDDFTHGHATEADAVSQMANLMGNERVSLPPYQPYRDYYRDMFEKDWDDNIAPTRRNP